ncbi:MAG: hypothetical protein ABJN22_08155 [Litorimonas sp.]
MDPAKDLAEALSPKVWVKFTRTTTDGVLSRILINGEILNFRHDKARRKLVPGIFHVISWQMVGNVGDSLSVSRDINGQTKVIVDKSVIIDGSRHEDFNIFKF